MSILSIKKAFEKKLSTLSPGIETAYEGLTYTPKTGTPYQKIQLVSKTPVNNVAASGFYREQGEFQIFLMYPTNKGTGDALKQAEAIRLLFKRGTNLVQDGLTILLFRTPTIAGAQVIGDRVIVPIIVPYICDVSADI